MPQRFSLRKKTIGGGRGPHVSACTGHCESKDTGPHEAAESITKSLKRPKPGVRRTHPRLMCSRARITLG